MEHPVNTVSDGTAEAANGEVSLACSGTHGDITNVVKTSIPVHP